MIANIIIGIISVLLFFLLKNKSTALKISFLLMTGFLAIRYDWGNDYPAYFLMFSTINSDTFTSLLDWGSLSVLRDSEPGWAFLNLLFGRLGLGFFGLIIALTIFENWVIYRFVKKYVPEKYYWLAVFFYVFNSEIFVIGASMMRQYLCVCCFLIVGDLMISRENNKLWNKNLLLSIGIILLCSTVHFSNFVVLAFLPLFYINFRTGKSFLPILFITLVLFVLWEIGGSRWLGSNIINFLPSSEIVEERFDIYIDDNKSYEVGLGRIFTYIQFFTIIYFLPFAPKKWQSILIQALTPVIIALLNQAFPMFYRFGFYGQAFCIAAMPILLSLGKQNLWIKVVIFGAAVFHLSNFIRLFFDPIWTKAFMHYQTIFSAPMWM